MAWSIADGEWVLTTPAARTRRRCAVLVAAAVAASSLVALPLATPAGAQDPTAPDPGTEVVAERGTMDSSVVALSSPEPTTARSALAAPGTAGWTTEVDLLDGTEMVALTWDAAQSGPDGPASGRVALRPQVDGEWGPWSEYAPDVDDLGAPSDRVGTDVVWLGSEGADAVQVRVDAGPLVDLQLLRMRYSEGTTRVVPVATPEAGADAGATTSRSTTSRAALPSIRPRSDWTTKPYACSGGPEYASSLRHAVVHHTVSTNTYTQAQVPGLIEGIRYYHTTGQGWCDIAYNFVVDRFGTIWQGRAGDIDRPVIGGHARGFNTGSVGVTLLGQFEPGASPTAATPSAEMLDSTARLLAWKLALHGLDPNGTTTLTSGGSSLYAAGRTVTLPIINAHQQTSQTACPGANVIVRLASLRTAVAGYTTTTPPVDPPPPPPPPTSWAPFPTVEDLVWRQFVDFRRDPATYEERRQWVVDLNNGQNRNALVAALVRSDWVDTRSASAVRLYLAYFGRIPDSGGIRYWWSQMDRGKGIRSVSADFAFSAEFRSRYGGLTDEQFVRLVYRNVMGREGEASGIAYWTGQLRDRRETRGGVMVQFSESAEYKRAKRDVVEVMHIHEVMLQRAISPTSHLQWVQKVSANGVGLFISTLFSSSEYASRVG